MTLGELVLKIKMMATQVGVEAALSPLLDSDNLIELVLPRVIDFVTLDIVKDASQLNALRADHALAFTAGVAALPATVKEEYIEAAFFGKNGAAYKKHYYDYRNAPSTMFSTWTVQNGNVYYRDPGENIATHSASEVLNAITYPSLPASESTAVSIKANILEQIIALTVSVVTGQVPLAKIGLDYQVEVKDAS